MDRFNLSPNDLVHVGAAFYHLSGERFEHQIDSGMGKRPQVLQERTVCTGRR
jgi:hypothetical protein